MRSVYHPTLSTCHAYYGNIAFVVLTWFVVAVCVVGVAIPGVVAMIVVVGCG